MPKFRKRRRPFRQSRKFKRRSTPYKRLGVKLGKPKVRKASGRVKKHVSAMHLVSARRFGPTRMSPSAVSALVNSLNPCSAAYSDSTGTARSVVQQQGWITMFAHTSSQLNAYHTWNPSISTATVPAYDTMNIKTLLEANRHTLWLQNFSLNNPVCITAYLVKPRLAVTTLEMPNSGVTFAGAGPLVFPNGGTVAEDLYKLIQNAYSQNTAATAPAFNPNTLQAGGASNKYPGVPTSSTPALTADGMLIPGETLFNNGWFVKRFKVLKTRKFTLKEGKRCKFVLAMPPRQLSFALNQWVNNGSAYVSPYVLYPHTRFWMISFHGSPAPFISKTDGTGSLVTIDAPPAVLGMYHTEQWCIRQGVHSLYPLSQRVSAKPAVTTNDVAVSFGRDTRVGETVNAGSGGLIATITGAGTTTNSNIVQTF